MLNCRRRETWVERCHPAFPSQVSWFKSICRVAIGGDGRHRLAWELLPHFNQLVTHMIRLTESTRIKLMILHGFAMMTLGLALFYIRATMTNLLFDVLGGPSRFCWWRVSAVHRRR